MVKVQQNLMEDTFRVLTPEQREKFEQMTGKRIDLSLKLPPYGPSKKPHVQRPS
jgi:hypothetical protein